MPTESISTRQIPDGKHTEKRAIPRFVSFKPSSPLEIQSQGIRAIENHQLPDHAPDESKSKHYKKGPSEHNSRGHHRTSPKRGLNSHVRLEPATQESEAYGSKPFVVDRGGDVNNLKFGTLHATASYFRYGAGNVVGLPRNQRIDRAVSTDKGLVLSNDTHSLLTTGDRHTRWRSCQKGVREFKIKLHEQHDPDVDSALDAADFVSLEAAQRAKWRPGGDALHVGHESSSDEYDTNYRSVEGNAKSKKEPIDQNVKYNSDTSPSHDIVGNQLATREQIRLSNRIDAEPTNSAAWIQLISHQDSMLGARSDRTRVSLTIAERRSVAEIKLAIFEKALEKVIDSQGREVLLLGMMQEATRVWERDKISSRWKSILREYSQSMQLWTKYLDFMQTSFTTFRFEKVQSAYRDCLNMIRGARNSGEMSAEEQNKVFEFQIYVVLRMTLFVREGGFAEHATAAWQALLEFAFFKPVILQGGDQNKHRLSDEATSMFENFWDSEVPRIGEEGAEGWATYFQKQGKPPQPRTEIADNLNYGKDRWKSWLASERRCSLSSRKPARTIDEIEENDPYRVVFFSDIRFFLIDPPSPAGQQLILDAFVAFCYLPPFAAEGPESPLRIWGRDCFLRNDPLRLNSKLQELWKLRSSKRHGSSEEKDSMEKGGFRLQLGTQDPLLLPVRDYQVCLDSLFGEKHWFSAFDIWQEQCSGDNGLVEVAWVLRSLKSLINICIGGEAVALYVLALELRISPGTVQRTAKNILRKRPFSIRLYNAYALVEYRLGDVNKGEGIIVTSINMGKKLDEVSQRDTVLLWRTWIWETLNACSAPEALERLLAIGDEEIQIPFPKVHPLDPSGSGQPALLLRTERALVAIRDHMLSLSSYSQAIFAVECLILLAYLSSGQSLPAATSVFKTNIAIISTHFSSTSSSHEYLHQTFARLLHYHTTHTHIFKPSDVRSFLAETITHFPHNTIFLSLYGWNEGRFRIDDRLRSVVEEILSAGNGNIEKRAPDSVVPHFFAIYSELHRAVTFGSNISTIRSTFERAVQSDSGAHCAGLWKLYFLFEHSRYEVERAKMVFWRSLKACPWAKDLYMIAFEYLRGEKVMDEAFLKGIYELLGEKELRVHIGLEDIFQV